MLAFTGLETVANLAAETRRPGVDLPRSVFGAIATVVTVYVAIAVVAVSAFPGPHTALGGNAGCARRSSASPTGSSGELPCWLGDALRFYVGLTGALILLAAVTTSISGFSRLAYSLGEHGQLPRALRAPEPPRARLAARDPLRRDHRGRARGRHVVLQARRAVPREPLLVRRPARVHRGPGGGDQAAHRRARPAATLPCAVQHHDRALVDPAARDRRLDRDVRDLDRRDRNASWRAVRRPGLARDRARRLRRGADARTGRGCSSTCVRRTSAPVEPIVQFHRILVPMKLGVIGEEMLATAVKLASEHGAAVEALHVIRVPLDQALDERDARRGGARRRVARRGAPARRGPRVSSSRERPSGRARSARRSSSTRSRSAPT